MGEIKIKTTGNTILIENIDPHKQGNSIYRRFFYDRGRLGMGRLTEKEYECILTGDQGSQFKEIDSKKNRLEYDRIIHELSCFLDDRSSNDRSNITDEDLRALNLR